MTSAGAAFGARPIVLCTGEQERRVECERHQLLMLAVLWLVVYCWAWMHTLCTIVVARGKQHCMLLYVRLYIRPHPCCCPCIWYFIAVAIFFLHSMVH